MKETAVAAAAGVRMVNFEFVITPRPAKKLNKNSFEKKNRKKGKKDSVSAARSKVCYDASGGHRFISGRHNIISYEEVSNWMHILKCGATSLGFSDNKLKWFLRSLLLNITATMATSKKCL